MKDPSYKQRRPKLDAASTKDGQLPISADVPTDTAQHPMKMLISLEPC